MLCHHMGGQLDGHILLLWQPAIVFLLLCYTVCYVCLANKLSLSHRNNEIHKNKIVAPSLAALYALR